MVINKKFIARLGELRIKAKMSRSDLAAATGIAPCNITNYETGKGTPNIDSLLKLSSVLKVSTDFLLGRTDIPDPYIHPDAPARICRSYTVRRHTLEGISEKTFPRKEQFVPYCKQALQTNFERLEFIENIVRYIP